MSSTITRGVNDVKLLKLGKVRDWGVFIFDERAMCRGYFTRNTVTAPKNFLINPILKYYKRKEKRAGTIFNALFLTHLHTSYTLPYT